MKKLTSVFISLLIILSLTITAFADVGGPSFNPYDVVVTAENGITASPSDSDEEKIVIPKGSIITVSGGYVFGDESVLFGLYDGRYVSFEENDGIELAVTSVDGSKAKKLDESYTIRIIAKDGMAIYSGPDYHYEIISNIPYGADITIDKVDNTNEPSWAYISYNGTDGWISIYPYSEDYDFAQVVNGRRNIYDGAYSRGNIVLIRDYIYLLNNPGNDYDSAKKVDIPAGTVIDYSLYALKPKSDLYYIEYQGNSGWAFLTSYEGGPEATFAESFVTECIITENSNLYKAENGKLVKTDKTISAGKELKTAYAYYSDGGWYGINFGGDLYWFSIAYCAEKHSESYELLAVDTNGITASDSISNGGKADKEIVIKADDVIKPVYETGDKYGFIADGQLYWADSTENKFADEDNTTIIICENTYGYTQPKASSDIRKIPANEIFRADFSVYEYNDTDSVTWYRVNYNGENVWVKDKIITADRIYKVKLSRSLDVFDDYFLDNESFTISEGEEAVVIAYDESLFAAYIEYNGKTGWINSVLAKNELRRGGWNSLDVDVYYYLYPEENPDNAEEISRINEDDKPGFPPVVKYAAVCGAAAVVLAITAVVTIALIKKSRKPETEAEESEETDK
ncbi:MAG: GW dipeptide domain-containing protein [Clostridia bacterium]|nr:GW dipeptide domain-containing protein [Clostridia bacterium]